MRITIHVGILALVVTSAGLRAETHTFIPQQFYTTYSSAHPPALRIKPGDRVITKTIDAGGVDWNGKTVSAGGNPETGPFYIEGAEAGDMIVVTFEKIETNRTTANSGSLLAPYTVDPAAIERRLQPLRLPRRETQPFEARPAAARIRRRASDHGNRVRLSPPPPRLTC